MYPYPPLATLVTFACSALPVTLWVEGVEASDVPGDIKLQVSSAGFTPDWITLTVVRVGLAMDGNRDDVIEFGGTNDDHYLFWVNDDYDYKYWWEDQWCEDDIRLFPSVPKNCDDESIGSRGPDASGNAAFGVEDACKRDLEDFTRLQILVDDTTTYSITI